MAAARLARYCKWRPTAAEVDGAHVDAVHAASVASTSSDEHSSSLGRDAMCAQRGVICALEEERSEKGPTGRAPFALCIRYMRRFSRLVGHLLRPSSSVDRALHSYSRNVHLGLLARVRSSNEGLCKGRGFEPRLGFLRPFFSFSTPPHDVALCRWRGGRFESCSTGWLSEKDISSQVSCTGTPHVLCDEPKRLLLSRGASA